MQTTLLNRLLLGPLVVWFLVTPGHTAEPGPARKPERPFRAWFQPAWARARPELYAHANLITSLGSGSTGEAVFWNSRGVAALHWAYGPNSPYAHGPSYFRDQCNPGNGTYRWAGVGVDEWNVHGKNAARNREWCARGLRLARRAWPHLFIAVWVTQPDPIFAGLLRDGTIDLAMIEGYTLIPTHPEWEVTQQGIEKRCEFLRRAGVLDKTIVCFGYVTAQPDRNGKHLTRAGLARLVQTIHRRFPEMPGVAFYGWSGDSSPATISLIRYADRLSQQYYPNQKGKSGPVPQAGAGQTTRWSWQRPHAKVLATGDLEWAPQPFEFKPGATVRYIDFRSGNDLNDGLSKQTPWKHHPWDRHATGRASACHGSHTYVFKQGVDYRGELDADESGTPSAPIVLTRDPSWGTGPAALCGSEVVTGWKKGADNPLIPEPEKVWYVDLNWAPRNVWMVRRDGVVTRIVLARTPNWTITDPDDIKSEWWTWKNPHKPFDNYALFHGARRHLAFDPEHINESRPPDYYRGAIVWTTKGWVMGSPFPARVLAVDRSQGSLTFPGQWGGGPSYKIIRGCRYYLEDKPQYLDSPGEFWFEKRGQGGRLYLRLPEDQDPNRARVEVAKRIHFIESRGMSHVHINGLTFRFSNVYWNLLAAPYWVSHESLDVEPGCVRLLGSGTDLRVTHCVFEHVHKGIRFKALGPHDAIDQVVIEDNRFSYTDSGAVEVSDGTHYGLVKPPIGRLYSVRVLRNRFDHIGLRPDLFGQGEALLVAYAKTAEIAGNIFDRVYAQGVDVEGAKASGAATDRPFTRLLIHHNKVVDSLLNVDDFGGIETWQGGPAYVYDNISGNPGGYRNWDHVLSPETEDRFGHAYYLDGAFKNYHFNNIAWGKSKGPSGKLANTSAFQEIISYQNTFFNNTIYNFVRGSRRQEPQAGRVKFLGNIWQSMGRRVFRDADPAKSEADGNNAQARGRRERYAIDTDAYARNVFYDLGEGFGVFEPSGRWHQTLLSFRAALETYHPLASGVGVVASKSPLRHPSAHDFRPAADSDACGRGVKVFVPWSLYETVAEWNFYPMPSDPARILDEHWCMSPYYTGRDGYYRLPTYPLKGVHITLKDYQDGPLENWTTGALHFNGRDQYAVLSEEQIDRPVTLPSRRGVRQRTIQGVDLRNPQWNTSDFLIEVYFKTVPGETQATLIQKLDRAGYAVRLNQAGGITLAARGPAAQAGLASHHAVNDGRWHHVIAEADRKDQTFTIYLDGKLDARGPGLGPGVSLANQADLYVGGSPQGHDLEGAIDFLRLARGTLADSKTTIAELYAWEFNGPFLYDFTGRKRPGGGGSAGALDEVSSAAKP